MVRTTGGMTIVDTSRRLRSVSIHSRRRIVQTMRGAHQVASPPAPGRTPMTSK